MASCATVPRAPAVTAPRYPAFTKPVAPASLAVASGVLRRHEVAWQRLQGGDLRGAARDFGEILRDAPGFYPAEAGLAFVDVAAQELERASRRFEAVVAIDGAYLPAWRGLADAQLGLGLEVEAIASFERVVALDPAQEAGLRGRIELLRFRQVQALVSASRRSREAGRLDEAAAALERALGLSSDSVVILRDLAVVERDRGALDKAVAHARRAVELDAADPEAYATLGSVLETRAELDQAAEAYARAATIDDRSDWRARSVDLANRARIAGLPAEFGSLATATQVTRGQVAALIGLRLEALLAAVPRRMTEVAIDVRSHWAAPWILPVTQAGIMEVFPNHTFQPNAVVRRADLARSIQELLAAAYAGQPADLARWTSGAVRFSDLPQSHVVYRAASTAVTAGAMTVEGGRFQPSRLVTGAELLAAVARVERLVER